MNKTKTDISHELGQQPHRIRCSAVSDTVWQLEDISEMQRGIHLSFIAAVGLGRHGFIELHFNASGELERTLIEAHQ